jgi:hypothetical protein
LYVNINSKGLEDIYASAGVSKTFRLWTPFHHYHKTYSASGSGHITSRNSKFSIHISVPGPDVTFHINLNGGSLVKASDLAGYHVFLDTNGNGVRDSWEPETIADEAGNFCFESKTFNPSDPVYPQYNGVALGALASFDADSSGAIDAEEGRFIVTGGYDIHTGAKNEVTYVLDASQYGALISAVSSPLTMLHDVLTKRGIDYDEAWYQLKAAFGIHYAGDLSLYDPNLAEAGFGEASHFMIETAYMDVNACLLTGYDMVKNLLNYENRAMEDSAIHDALLSSLAEMVSKVEYIDADLMVDAGGNAIYKEAALNLSDKHVLSELFDHTLKALSLDQSVHAEALKTVASHQLSVQLTYVNALKDSQIVNFTEALSRVKYLFQFGNEPVYAKILTGELSAEKAVEQYGHIALLEQLKALDIPYKNAVPEIANLENVNVKSGDSAEVVLKLQDKDGLPGDITIVATTDNSDILDPASMELLGNGEQRTLLLKPSSDFAGKTTITFHVTDGFSPTGVTTQTMDFTVLSQFTMGEAKIIIQGTQAYFAVSVSTNVKSNVDVNLHYKLGGSALEGVHYQSGDGLFVMKAGETSGTLLVRLLGSPMKEGMTLELLPVSLENAYFSSDETARSLELPYISGALISGGSSNSSSDSSGDSFSKVLGGVSSQTAEGTMEQSLEDKLIDGEEPVEETVSNIQIVRLTRGFSQAPVSNASQSSTALAEFSHHEEQSASYQQEGLDDFE